MADDPFLKEGYAVWIDDPYNGFYKIVRKEPFDFMTGEESPAIFSTVASGTESGFRNIDQLEPDNDPLHLYQVLWGVADFGDIKYYLKVPAGQNRLGVDKDKEIGFINADKSPFYDPSPLFQFWLIHDWIPAINCVNGSPVIVRPKVWFRGMKYDIEKIPEARAGAVHSKVVLGGIKNTP